MAKGTGRRKLRINRWVALAFGAFVAGAVVLIPMLAGASAIGTVSVSPTTVTAGNVTVDFAFDRGAKGLYIVDIAIPSGWSSVTVTRPTDNCGMSSNTVTGHVQYTGNCNSQTGPWTVTLRLAATVQTAGNYTFTIQSGNGNQSSSLGSLATQSVTVNPAAASKLAFTQQPSGGASGATWSTQPAVAVQDQFGNTVTSGTTSTVSVTLTPSVSIGLSCTDNPKNATSGSVSFAGCKALKPGTGYTLTASATGLTSGISNPFSVTSASLTTSATAAHGTTYFQCNGGTGRFGDDINFVVNSVPVGADAAKVTLGTTNVALTRDTSDTTKWLGTLAKGTTVSIGSCPTYTNSPGSVGYSASASWTGTQIGSGSGSVPVGKIDP